MNACTGQHTAEARMRYLDKWVGGEKLADVKDSLGDAVEGIKGKISGLFGGE